ncbi:hypothetical protein O0I10_009940 [Lichtheimia ornata]|uniref:DUF1763-domain-containing protein n=1 Tax=Lichtheimia ornata TaxID=688661 RepID=A0AAD7UVY0_9FUNG|nr:uncharacterized protein O0I10_009940 [Lichtheimia ornata]KAJ8654372.1 hypothetical protein O0I10_009940 [Lichtheimia ornata]
MASFTQSYRTFLKAGYAAVGHRAKDKQAIRDRIRSRFEHGDMADPVKSENTLRMLIDASHYRGMERAVVRNICRLYALEKEYAIRPPFYNRKLRPEIKHLHDHAYDDIHLLVQMLNKEMNLCL